MSDNFIDSLTNMAATAQSGANSRKRKKRPRDTTYDPVANVVADDTITMANVLNDLNTSSHPMATIIIEDGSLYKQQSLQLIGNQNGVAKSLVKDIDEGKTQLQLTKLRATNVLKMLSNVYDNRY